jgi:hypothetical protein
MSEKIADRYRNPPLNLALVILFKFKLSQQKIAQMIGVAMQLRIPHAKFKPALYSYLNKDTNVFCFKCI